MEGESLIFHNFATFWRKQRGKQRLQCYCHPSLQHHTSRLITSHSPHPSMQSLSASSVISGELHVSNGALRIRSLLEPYSMSEPLPSLPPELQKRAYESIQFAAESTRAPSASKKKRRGNDGSKKDSSSMPAFNPLVKVEVLPHSVRAFTLIEPLPQLPHCENYRPLGDWKVSVDEGRSECPPIIGVLVKISPIITVDGTTFALATVRQMDEDLQPESVNHSSSSSSSATITANLVLLAPAHNMAKHLIPGDVVGITDYSIKNSRKSDPSFPDQVLRITSAHGLRLHSRPCESIYSPGLKVTVVSVDTPTLLTVQPPVGPPLPLVLNYYPLPLHVGPSSVMTLHSPVVNPTYIALSIQSTVVYTPAPATAAVGGAYDTTYKRPVSHVQFLHEARQMHADYCAEETDIEDFLESLEVPNKPKRTRCPYKEFWALCPPSVPILETNIGGGDGDEVWDDSRDGDEGEAAAEIQHEKESVTTEIFYSPPLPQILPVSRMHDLAHGIAKDYLSELSAAQDVMPSSFFSKTIELPESVTSGILEPSGEISGFPILSPPRVEQPIAVTVIPSQLTVIACSIISLPKHLAPSPDTPLSPIPGSPAFFFVSGSNIFMVAPFLTISSIKAVSCYDGGEVGGDTGKGISEPLFPGESAVPLMCFARSPSGIITMHRGSRLQPFVSTLDVGVMNPSPSSLHALASACLVPCQNQDDTPREIDLTGETPPLCHASYSSVRFPSKLQIKR